jgi:hypothetical protein
MAFGVYPLTPDRPPQPNWPDSTSWIKLPASLADIMSVLANAGCTNGVARVSAVVNTADDPAVILLSRNGGSVELLLRGRLVPLDAAAKAALLAWLQQKPQGQTDAPSSSMNQGLTLDPAREADVMAQIRAGAVLPANSTPPEAADAVVQLGEVFSLPYADDPRHLARLLAVAFEQSGLFFESHVVQWLMGKRPISALMEEVPRLSRVRSSSKPGAGRADIQLDVMHQQAVCLNGVIAPDTPLYWGLSWQKDESGGTQAEQKAAVVITAQIRLELPALGKLAIKLRVCESTLGVHVESVALGANSAALEQLKARLEAQGLSVLHITLLGENANG